MWVSRFGYPNGLVGAIQVVYNNGVPEYVDTEYVSTGETPMIQPPADPNDPAEGLQEKRTLWYDGLQGMIHAYNREGRVFMELLGDARGPVSASRSAMRSLISSASRAWKTSPSNWASG